MVLLPTSLLRRLVEPCYKSEDKITEDSAVKFVQGLVKRKHYAMLEHHWVHMVMYDRVDNTNGSFEYRDVYLQEE